MRCSISVTSTRFVDSRSRASHSSIGTFGSRNRRWKPGGSEKPTANRKAPQDLPRRADDPQDMRGWRLEPGVGPDRDVLRALARCRTHRTSTPRRTACHRPRGPSPNRTPRTDRRFMPALPAPQRFRDRCVQVSGAGCGCGIPRVRVNRRHARVLMADLFRDEPWRGVPNTPKSTSRNHLFEKVVYPATSICPQIGPDPSA
jgi:hypothetical protein